MIILDLSLLNSLDVSKENELLVEIKNIKNFAEKKFSQRIDAVRIGEEFCAHKLRNYNSNRIQQYVSILYDLGQVSMLLYLGLTKLKVLKIKQR